MRGYKQEGEKRKEVVRYSAGLCGVGGLWIVFMERIVSLHSSTGDKSQIHDRATVNEVVRQKYESSKDFEELLNIKPMKPERLPWWPICYESDLLALAEIQQRLKNIMKNAKVPRDTLGNQILSQTGPYVKLKVCP